MTPSAAPEGGRTTRGEIEGWVEGRLRRRERVDMPALADELRAHLLQRPALLRAFVEEGLYHHCYRAVVGVIRKTRWEDLRAKPGLLEAYECPAPTAFPIADADEARDGERRAQAWRAEEDRLAEVALAEKARRAALQRSWREAQEHEDLWAQWRETVAPHVTVLLPAMTREDLLAAAARRRQAAAQEARLAGLWGALAAGLAPGQRVDERYSPAEVAGLASAPSAASAERREPATAGSAD